MTGANQDRIVKQIDLRAPITRVWRALTDATEFGVWFGVTLDGEFEVGRRLTGRVTHPGYEHVEATMVVTQMDAPHAFAFRSHPHPVDPDVDYSQEPMTLVEVRLEEIETGTRLRLVESGFEQLPPWRRDLAFRMNDGGWTAQMENIRAHVERGT